MKPIVKFLASMIDRKNMQTWNQWTKNWPGSSDNLPANPDWTRIDFTRSRARRLRKYRIKFDLFNMGTHIDLPKWAADLLYVSEFLSSRLGVHVRFPEADLAFRKSAKNEEFRKALMTLSMSGGAKAMVDFLVPDRAEQARRMKEFRKVFNRERSQTVHLVCSHDISCGDARASASPPMKDGKPTGEEVSNIRYWNIHFKKNMVIRAGTNKLRPANGMIRHARGLGRSFAHALMALGEESRLLAEHFRELVTMHGMSNQEVKGWKF